MIAAPFAILALACVAFIEEVPLRTTLDTPGAEVGEPARHGAAATPVLADEQP